MKKTIYAIVSILIIAALILGCSQQIMPNKKTTSVKNTVDMTPEEVLVREIADGKLVEVYDEYVRVSAGKVKKNWMIINNVKDNHQQFTIFPCSGCNFDEEKINIAAGEYKIITFTVSADEGQKEIRVKDNHNNAYGYAKISVIVE